jgi:hypothetical protein
MLVNHFCPGIGCTVPGKLAHPRLDALEKGTLVHENGCQHGTVL